MDRRADIYAYFRHETMGLWDCWLVPGNPIHTIQEDTKNLVINKY